MSAPASDAAAAVPTVRVDAREKVTGALRYGTDRTPPGLLHAALAVATVAKGRIVALDTAAAERVPGVRLVLTRVELGPAGYSMGGGFGFQSVQPLQNERIAHRGQPIALVVADTPHAAVEAAELVRADYAPEPAATTLDDPGAETLVQSEVVPTLPDVVVGDADAVLAACVADDGSVVVDAVYDTPAQHHNPMELIGSVVGWRRDPAGDVLVVHEGTQNVAGVQHGLAAQLGIPAERIEVIAPSTGGAFGQKTAVQSHTALAAVAARRLGRPVKLVVPRAQLFNGSGFRPAGRHRVRIAADRTGRMRAAVHEADQQTSRHDLFPARSARTSAHLYRIPDFRSRMRLVRTDTQTPTVMRAPHEHGPLFAFESAVDELAVALGQDPVALRLANDTDTDPVTGVPFSSRFLAECLRRGADRFGWDRRNPEPGSMRAADGSRIGWGVAVGAYAASTAPTTARVRAHVDGTVVVEVGAHEMGQGVRTAVARTVAADLGVATTAVTVVAGDTRVLPHHLTAGSWGTTGAVPAVVRALAALRAELGVAAEGPVDPAAALAAVGRDAVTAEAVHIARGQPEEVVDRVRGGLLAQAGPQYPGFAAFSYVAHFVEVRIEPVIHRIRVPRVVSVADCGRVASPTTAANQLRGGVVWGISGTLRERSEVDPRYGGFLNASLEEYPVAVNADIGEIDVDFVDVPDPLLNPAGVKGLGEVAMAGVAPAIANAVHHATGRRIRHLPIRLEDVL